MNEAAALVRRWILPDQKVMLARGDFSALFAAWHEHADRWDLPLDGLGEIMMHQGLAGAALQLSFRVPEETTAWTLNVQRPPANLFVTGGGPEHTLTGRYYADGVEETGFNRLFVQRAHPHAEHQRSVSQVEGIDVLDIYEQFFRRSEQVAARFLEHDAVDYSMVLGLPDAEVEWVSGLESLDIDGLQAGAELLDEQKFVLHCGCSADRVAGTLARMFANQADEFFAGSPVVEALCPRCGARHLLDRETFDALVREL